MAYLEKTDHITTNADLIKPSPIRESMNTLKGITDKHINRIQK